METTTTTTVLQDGLCFPEGPRFRDGALWFSDMHALHVMRLVPDGRAQVMLEVPNCPSGLGWLPGGDLLVVSMTDRRLLRWDGRSSATHADLSELASFHLNDMVVDARGNAYVGNFGFDLHAGESPKPAELILVTPDGEARVVADEMQFPNGTVVTPDGQTLIVGESFGGRLTAFDILANGDLANRRVWAELPHGAVPDGICLDAEGAIWIASPISAEVLRVSEGGAVTHRVPVETQAFACMLGGPERRHLFVCTALDSDPARCRETRSGRIEVVEVDVPGAGRP
jgi:sugar lactone lactonase YvrE